MPVSHVIHGPARQVFRSDAGQVEDEHIAVHLNVLVSTRISSHDGHGVHFLRYRKQLAVFLCRS